MLEWQKGYDLSKHNSFGFKVTAERFSEIDAISDLEDALSQVQDNEWPLLILGGGSNLVLQSFIPGAVIKIATKGIAVLAEDGDTAIVEAGAGENWHQFVGHLIEKGLHGLENLALIPGSVGAAPVQNIGAYGVEVSDCLHSITAYDRKRRELVQLGNEQCQFDYRDSLFKSKRPNRYIIWSVRFILKSTFQPKLSYRVLGQYIEAQGIEKPNAHQVYKAVCDIRSSKLPIPSKIGNAGSFFENPLVSESEYLRLKSEFPDLVGHKDASGSFKLAAGWLIDKAGWKGHEQGGVGVYEKQALVLVNLGDGNAQKVLALADAISASVYEKYKVKLVMEPRIYPQ